VDRLRARGISAIFGDAANPEVLELAHLEQARLVIVTTADAHETRLIVERARAARPTIDLIVRTHSDLEAAHLRGLGGKVQPIHGERELAVQMARYSLRRFGVSATEAEAIAQGLRGKVVASSAAGQGPGIVARLRSRWRAGGASRRAWGAAPRRWLSVRRGRSR
jgi:CPA2 family monovalent cation:H+ antiporter-2